jgi:hypothetical protein
MSRLDAIRRGTMQPQGIVESRLRSLDRDSLIGFVADLWAARGFETVRDAPYVLARKDDRETRILVRSHRNWRRGPWTTVDDSEAHVVVLSGCRAGSDSGSGGTESSRVVDVTDLRTMLWYAVDEPTRRDLCRRYLGAPPDGLDPPLLARVRTAASAWTAQIRQSTADGLDSAGAVRVGALLVGLTLVAVVLAAGMADPAGSGGGGAAIDAPAEDAVRSSTSTSTSTSTKAGPPSESGVDWDAVAASRTPPPNYSVVGFPDGERPGFPPGIGPGGVVNRTRLADAHAAALSARSYRLQIETGRLYVNDDVDDWENRTTEITVAGNRSLLVETVTLGDRTNRDRAVYTDGADWFVADGPVARATYRQFDDAGPLTGPPPGELGRYLVSRYLGGSDVEVHKFEGEPQAGVLLVGTGPPPGTNFNDFREYRVRARVSADGLVTSLRASFELPAAGGSLRLRVAWQYRDVGTTVVDPPEWYFSEFNATRKLASGPWPCRC